MKLKKELKLLDVFCITTGAMLSCGLFLLPGLAYAKAGPAVFLSYFIAGLLAVTGVLSQAELATAMPKSGGTYYYVTRSMGIAVGTVYGLITMLALSLKSAFELIAMATFTAYLINIDIRIIAVSLCLIFLIINIVGVKGAGRIQIILVFIILPALIVYLIFGFPEVNLQHFQPFASKGVMAVFSTAGFVFVSYGGLLKIASIAEEIKEPGKVLPKGMLLSLLVVIIVYMMVIFVTTGVLDAAILGSSKRPITDGAFTFLGSWGGIALSIVAILGFSSAANAGIMGSSRYPLALSRDYLLPGFLGNVNERFKTPHNAILLTGILVIASTFLKLDTIIKAASSVLILTYIFSCAANIIMRESRLQNYQPSFRAPFYPWIQIIGIIGFGFLLFEIGKEGLLISSSLIACGFLVYLFYGRDRSKREYALLHLIERITAKELTSHSLESELKEVIRERDEIIEDRFDSIIENSVILDIEKAIHVEEFFRICANEMAKNLKMKPNLLLKLLIKRERESSTVLTSCMAIPHIVIKGAKTFDILVARCKEGVIFSESERDVNAIFILIGTKDERNFHLRALSAIAQIVQDTDFEEKWLKAKGKDVLRDIVLLGKRRR